MAEGSHPSLLPLALGRALVRLAHEAVSSWVREGRRIPSPLGPPALLEPRGVFVTLTRDGDLRGCIGYPLPTRPLGEAAIECAVSAAVRDPRFPPLSSDELDGLGVEVSVLTVPATCRPDGIEVGRHGLIVSDGNRRGLLLPQVAVEHGWDRETFLDHTCLKAGLPPSAWREPDGVTLEAFSAQVFGEDDTVLPSVQ